MTEACPLVDSHHHIWRLADLAWLSGPTVPRIFGPYDSIRRDYPIEEFRAEAEAAGAVKSVYVQTNWPAGGAVPEAEWVRDVAQANDGWPHATVAYTDLGSEDAADTLAQLSRIKGVVGIRQQIHWHENPQYRFASRPDLMNDGAWQRNFARLADYDFSFDIQLFTGQMADGAAFAKAFPGTTLVLQHAGMLEDLSPAGWAAWREGMKRLADQPNVVSKLSGLGTFVHAVDPSLINAIVRETVEMFGADRCLFGSNFPVEKLWTDYASLAQAHRDALAHLPADQQRAVLHDNAVRIYKL
ncbi:amidohydrolase family protein [Aquabacter sp. CN5-332]|uniref:amidohydrolase family protein n=1 Tax=Aquabacter sp. CN5-332 TaxID=3156608 RepID=UPI0032B54FFF